MWVFYLYFYRSQCYSPCFIIVYLSVVVFFFDCIWYHYLVECCIWPITIILIFCHILSVVCFILSIYKVKCCMTNYDFLIRNYYFIYNILLPLILWMDLVHHLLVSVSNLSVTPLILSVSVSLTTLLYSLF